jgi:hypothetical protein
MMKPSSTRFGDQESSGLRPLSLDETEMVGGGGFHWDPGQFNLRSFARAVGHGVERGAVEGAARGFVGQGVGLGAFGPLGALEGAIGGGASGGIIAGAKNVHSQLG